MDTRARTNDLLARLQRQPRDRMSDGRGAWHELRRASQGTSDLVGKKLPGPVADRIARQLHEALELATPVLAEAGVSMTQLARTAFGEQAADSKNIARLCLPPGADPVKRGIRRSALQFRQLIGAIAQHTGQNEELLADEVLAGTPLHPATASTPGFDELDHIVLALGGIVNAVDKEFGLFGTFARTAQARQKNLEAGGSLCWPQYDLEPPLDESDLERYRQDRTRAADPKQAWWAEDEAFGMPGECHWQPRGFGSGVLQDESFFYVPHFLLGEVLLWDLPDPHADRALYELAVARELEKLRTCGGLGTVPSDEFDAEARKPAGQTYSPAPSGHISAASLQYCWWLAIYPDPRGRRLVPVLYQPGEEGGAYLMPLDLQALGMLRHAISATPDGAMPLSQRLRQLLSDPEAPILQAFRRTAPWLAHNPLLQWEERRRSEIDTLAAAAARLNQRSRLSAA